MAESEEVFIVLPPGHRLFVEEVLATTWPRLISVAPADVQAKWVEPRFLDGSGHPVMVVNRDSLAFLVGSLMGLDALVQEIMGRIEASL